MGFRIEARDVPPEVAARRRQGRTPRMRRLPHTNKPPGLSLTLAMVLATRPPCWWGCAIPRRCSKSGEHCRAARVYIAARAGPHTNTPPGYCGDGRKIDGEIELGRLLDRNFARLRPRAESRGCRFKRRWTGLGVHRSLPARQGRGESKVKTEEAPTRVGARLPRLPLDVGLARRAIVARTG
jgi:hypothetical protein